MAAKWRQYKIRKCWGRAAVWGNESVSCFFFRNSSSGKLCLSWSLTQALISNQLSSQHITAHRWLSPKTPKSVDLRIYFQFPGQDGLSCAISASLIQPVFKTSVVSSWRRKAVQSGDLQFSEAQNTSQKTLEVSCGVYISCFWPNNM